MPAHLRQHVAVATLLALLVAAVPFGAPATPAEAAPLAADAAAVTASAITAAGITTGNLRSVAFVSATTGLAAADNGIIMRTTDGGQNWTQVRVADSYAFRGIDFWADGMNGVAVDYAGKLAYTIDGGTTWTNENFAPDPDMDGPTTSNPNRTHNDVACSPTSGAVMAAAGDEAPLDGNPYGATLMGAMSNRLKYWHNPLTETKPHVEYNSGSLEWEDVGRGELLDVDYEGTTIWASGIDYFILNPANPSKYPLFKSTDGGATYTKIEVSSTVDLRLEGVSFGSDTAGITVGQAVGGNRVAYYTTNGGTTWTPATTLPGTVALNAVYMSSSTQAWAASEDGTIIRTIDGGVTWTDCTISGGNTFPLYDIEFRNGTDDGWAVGASGTVLLTTDGTTWGRPNSAPEAAADAYSTPANTAKVVGAPGVLGNDTDADGSGLTASKVAGPSHGTLSLADNGGFTYTPVTGYSGIDSFTYRAFDGVAYSNTVTVTLTVGTGAPVTMPVFRFYNAGNNTHFFTPSIEERDMVMLKWPTVYTYEGVAYSLNPYNNTQPLTRLYNKASGSHFYTASPSEAADALAKWPTVFSLDGLTYAVNPAPVANSDPVYRFYNMKNGSHFFTASADERNTVIAKWPDVYQYEGPAFWLGQ